MSEGAQPTNQSPPKLAKIKERAGWLCWAPNILGLILLAVRPSHESLQDFDGSVFVLGLLGCYSLSLIAHEFGHYAAGRLVGFKFWCVKIGVGPAVFDHEFDAFRLLVKRAPYAGAVYHSALAQHKWARLRTAIMVGGGPACNAALLEIFMIRFNRHGGFPMDLSQAPGFTNPMIFSNVILLIFTLLPHRGKLDGAPIASDGLRLILLALNRPGTPAANSQTTAPQSFAPSRRWLIKHASPEPILNAYKSQLDNPNLTVESRSQLLDAFATAVLLWGASEFLPEAAKCSEELFQIKPDEWTVKGTRGSILVDLGEIDAGMTMLQEVMDSDPSIFDRAICASFLALGEFKRNNLDAARKWAAIARSLDPNCEALYRLKSLFPEA